MRKVVFGGASSLDNYFARKDGSVDWIVFGEEANELMKGMWDRFDVMIMGRKTWEFASGGKTPSKKKSKKAASGIKTYVFSRTMETGEFDGGLEILDGDPGEFVREIKQQEGKDICVMGGGDLPRTLLEAGVIDEIGFNIHPVLLGSGIPIFYEMSRQIDLELIECQPMSTGCVYVRYHVKN